MNLATNCLISFTQLLCETEIGKNSKDSQNQASEYASITFDSLSALFAAIITSFIL
ncbi:hypothetical protein HOF65_05155 [bacterium]|jgi:hypothetical protein|nr:hypothetical protein [bacterium]